MWGKRTQRLECEVVLLKDDVKTLRERYYRLEGDFNLLCAHFNVRVVPENATRRLISNARVK